MAEEIKTMIFGGGRAAGQDRSSRPPARDRRHLVRLRWAGGLGGGRASTGGGITASRPNVQLADG